MDGIEYIIWRHSSAHHIIPHLDCHAFHHALLYTAFPPHRSQSPLPSPLPVPNVFPDNPGRLLGTMLSPDCLDKIALGIHQVKVNTMVDQIILTLLDSLGRREVNPVFLTDVFDLFPRARQSNDARMEFREVGGQNGGGITGRVARNEDGEERWG